MTCLYLEGASPNNPAPSFIQGRPALRKFVNTYFLSKGGVLFSKKARASLLGFSSLLILSVQRRNCCSTEGRSFLHSVIIFKGQKCLEAKTLHQAKGNYDLYFLFPRVYFLCRYLFFFFFNIVTNFKSS